MRISDWSSDVCSSDLLASLTINGMEAATGTTRLATTAGPFDLRLLTARGAAGTVYRFLFATPAGDTARMTEGLQQAGFSLRELDMVEAAAVEPYRLRLRRVASGDTVARLARRMTEGPQREARFRVLNGLGPGQEPVPGQMRK